MLLPIKLATDKTTSKKKKVTPVTPEEQAKGFASLEKQRKIEEQQIAEFIARQNYNPAEEARKRGVSVPVQPYEQKINTGQTVGTPVLSGAELVQRQSSEPKAPAKVQKTPQGLVKKTISTIFGDVEYVATPKESKIFESGDINAINNLTRIIAKDFEQGGREQGLKPKASTKEKYTFDKVNAALNPNFIDEETRKGVKSFEDKTLGRLDVLGVRKSLNELADYAKQSENPLAQLGGGLLEGAVNPMTSFAMSTGNIVDPNATLEERAGAVGNLALYALPIGQFAGAASAGASGFKQGLSAGLRNAIKVGTREYAKNTLFGNLALREITLDAVTRQLRNAGEIEGNVLKFKNELRREAKRSGVNPSDYLKQKYQEAETIAPASTPATAPIQDADAVVDDALKSADEAIQGTTPVTLEPVIEPSATLPIESTPTAPVSVVDEANQAADDILKSAPQEEPFIDTTNRTREKLNAIADEDEAWLEQYQARKMNTRQAGFELEDYEAMARMARSFAIKYGYNKIDDALQLVVRAYKERFGIDVALTNEDRQAITNAVNALEGKTSPVSEPPLSAPMIAEQPPVPPTQTATTAIPEAPQEQFTSAKNAMTAEVRDEFNLEGFDEPTKKTWEEVFTKAKQNIVANPNLVDELVIKVNNQIPLTDVEQSALVVGLSRAKQQARKLLKDKLNATNSKEIAMLTDQAKVAEQKVDQYTNALNQTGTETSRALNFRRAIIDAQEDLVSIRAEARQVYGKDLPKDVEDTINDVGTGLEDINKQIEEATGLGDTPADVAKANTQVKSIKKDLPKISPKKTKAKELENEKVIQKLKDAFTQIRRPKEPINTLGASVERTAKDPASVDYFTDLSKLQTDAGKVIRDIIKNDLIEDFDELLNRMNELGIDVTDQDLKLILSGEYPTPTKLYDFNEIEKEYLKAVRRQLSKDAKDSPIAQRARIIKQIEKIGQNIATKTGIKKKPIQQIFAENLDMQNRLDDLQRQYAEMTEVPRERARLEREIDKLKKEIENPVLAQKIEREVPAELKNLYIERNNLRSQKNQILTNLALQAEKENNPIAYKVMTGFNTLNELKFGADLDAANTHGLLFALHDPAWYRAAFDGLASLASKAKAKQFRARMMADPDYEEAVRSGLAGIKSRDLDAFVAHSSNLEKVPVLKIFYGAGNRFNEAFYAQLRLSLFKQYKQPLPFRDAKLFSDAELKQMSEAINNMTGRAEGIPGAILRGKELSKFNRVVFPTLNFYTSRWQLATATPLTRAIAQKNWHLVGKIAQSYAKFIGAAVLTGKLVEAKTGYKMSLDPINEPEKLFAFVDKDGNVVASPYKNIIQPLQLLLNTEVIRSAKVKAGLVSSEKDLEKKNIYETLTATTQPVINRIGVAPMAAYNLAMGIADKDYKSFGKSFDPTTREGAINLLMQFAPISASQAAENTQQSETVGEGIKSALIGKYTNPPFNKSKSGSANTTSDSTSSALPPARQ